MWEIGGLVPLVGVRSYINATPQPSLFSTLKTKAGERRAALDALRHDGGQVLQLEDHPQEQARERGRRNIFFYTKETNLGNTSSIFSLSLQVTITINGRQSPVKMTIGETGEACFTRKANRQAHNSFKKKKCWKIHI